MNNRILNGVVQATSNDGVQRRLYHMKLFIVVHVFTSPTTLKATTVQGPRHFLLCVYFVSVLVMRQNLACGHHLNKWMDDLNRK